MNNLKKQLTTLIVGFIFSAGASVCSAQGDSIYTVLDLCAGLFKYANQYEEVMNLQINAQNAIKTINESWHQGSKDKIVQEAKKQDKFILLFVGRPVCGRCQETFKNFNSSEPESILKNGFVSWYSCYNNRESDVQPFISDFVSAGYAFPYLFVIDPYDPDNVIISSRNFEERALMNLIQRHLTPNNLLTWASSLTTANEDAMLNNKLVLSFYGRPTSHNSISLMEKMGEEPLKSYIEKKFVLLYYEMTEPLSWSYLDEHDKSSDLPCIVITDPNNPGQIWVESNIQDSQVLEQLLEDAVVYNEGVSLPQDNNVFIHNNQLYVSNHTTNETIEVFSVMGQKVHSFQKTDFQVTVDATLFPKGLIIVSSSHGWNVKIMNR